MCVCGGGGGGGFFVLGGVGEEGENGFFMRGSVCVCVCVCVCGGGGGTLYQWLCGNRVKVVFSRSVPSVERLSKTYMTLSHISCWYLWLSDF